MSILSTFSEMHPNKIIELCYTSIFLKNFAEDYGYYGKEFSFDKTRRSILRADIDGFMGHCFGISRENFSYILDTFTTLKTREEKAYNIYRTKEMCLESFDRLANFH